MKEPEFLTRFLDQPMTKRDLLRVVGVTGIGLILGKDSDSKPFRVYGWARDAMLEFGEDSIAEGEITHEDVEQWIKAREIAIDKFRKWTKEGIYKDRRLSYEPSLSLKDVHNQRTARVQEEGKYTVTSILRVEDLRVNPLQSFGQVVAPFFNAQDQLVSVGLESFPGGSRIINEIARHGVVDREQNRFGFGDPTFSNVPEEHLVDVANAVFKLPRDVQWGKVYSDLYEQDMLEGSFHTAFGETGAVSFDVIDGLPKLVITNP